MTKNERRLIPYFLDHYRKLGIGQFFFVDNGSADGTIEFLRSQPDCSTFFTNDDFKESRFGATWLTEIVYKYCQNRWVMQADADELLVFSDCENVSLESFCAMREKEGANTVYAAMIDMYSDSYGDMETCLRSRAPMLFDGDYIFREWPRRFWDPPRDPFFLQVIGGPRARLLADVDREARRSSLHYTFANQIDRFVDYVPQWLMPQIAAFWPAELPALQKRPLNFIGANFSYFNPHGNSNTLLSQETVALKHLKFIGDSFERYIDPILLSNHYRKGLSYLQLQRSVKMFSKKLKYSGSIEYIDSGSFGTCGLIGQRISRLWREGVASVRISAQNTGFLAKLETK